MTDTAIKRINRDLEKFVAAEKDLPGIWIDIDEDDVRKMKAIIVGPDDTIYADAFMYFDVTFTDRYPFAPPKVKHLTHQTKNCRLHPNLYGREGKVCLSILGTWQGPGWASTMGLTTVLLTIQALLDNEPLRHEPGYKTGREEAVKSFTKATEFNALDVGVLEMIKRTDIPEELKDKMKDHFRNNVDKYIERTIFLKEKYPEAEEVSHHYSRTKTNFHDLYERMKALAHEMKEEEPKKIGGSETDDSATIKSQELFEGF